MKYFFRNISWNTYLTIFSLCKLPRNVHDILFERFHEIWKFWKSIFRIFSIMKHFTIEFVSMLDKLFCYQWRLQKFKRKCKYYVKASQVVFFFCITKFEEYWRWTGVAFLTILMQLQDFKRNKHRGGMKTVSVFFHFLKNDWSLTEAAGSCSKRRCSEVYFCLGIWGVLDSITSVHIDKIRCSAKSVPSCVGYWRVLDYILEGKLQATWQN